jgi:hypothetical protein
MGSRLTAMLVLVFFQICTVTARERFAVVFLADVKYASDPAWVEKIKSWGATGVNLRVSRWAVEQAYGRYNWQSVRSALVTLAKADLDVYVRVSMGLLSGTLASAYGEDDFHQTNDRSGRRIYYNYHFPPTVQRPILNLTSERARGDMLRFFSAVRNELASMDKRVRSRIKLLVPTISPDDETELPSARQKTSQLKDFWAWLTGYSQPEKRAFVQYLRKKYGTVGNLQRTWGPGIETFSTEDIDIDTYDWERLKSTYRHYPEGRKDFIDFRWKELKRFIDSCARMAHPFPFGVQFGSVYDAAIEFKGFYDVTALLENVDAVIIDDVPEYAPNFSFAVAYLRSIGRFWDKVKDRPAGSGMKFFTESNWPGYRYYEPNTLVRYWIEQLTTYHEGGGAGVFISHWGTDDIQMPWPNRSAPERVYVAAQLVKADSLDAEELGVKSRAYRKWRRTLVKYSHAPVHTVLPNSTVHIGCEQVLYSRGSPSSEVYHVRNRPFRDRGEIPGDDRVSAKAVKLEEFPLSRFFREATEEAGAGESKANQSDVVTNFMLSRCPEFVFQYDTLRLSRASYYMSDAAFGAVAALRHDSLVVVGARDRSGSRLARPGARDDYDKPRPTEMLYRSEKDQKVR